MQSGGNGGNRDYYLKLKREVMGDGRCGVCSFHGGENSKFKYKSKKKRTKK